MAFVRVARLEQVPVGKGLQVEVAGKKLALFRVEAAVRAIDGLCPHRHAPLAQGKCEGDVLTCPWHDAKFELSSGKVLCGPAKSGVASYPAEVRGSKVFVDVPGAKPSWWQRLFGG